MMESLQVLSIEDSELDAELILRELRRGLSMVTFERVDTAEGFNAALDRKPWDIVICDYVLPRFGVLPALAMVRQRAPYMPFIVVSGMIGEEAAVEAMKLGANDYVMKDNLVRLVPAVKRELAASKMRWQRAHAEQALRESEARYRGLVEHASDGIFVVNEKGGFVLVNPRFCEMAGYSEKELLKLQVSDTYPEEHGRNFSEAGKPGHPAGDCYLERAVRRPDGTVLRTEVSFRWFDKSHGQGIVRDITERKRAEDALALEQRRIKRLNRIHAMLSAIGGLIIRVRNPDELYREACRIAVEAGQFLAAYVALVVPGVIMPRLVASISSDESYLGNLRRNFAHPSMEAQRIVHRVIGQKQPLVIRNVKPGQPGSSGELSASTDAGASCVLPLIIADRTVGMLGLHARETDIFDAEEMVLLLELAGDIAFSLDRLDKAGKLDYLAYYDQLTGLANTRLFRERLAQYLHAASSSQQRIALVMFDLERFKTINDALGWPAGDALLKQLAERLAGYAGSLDEVGHLDSDHFAMIVGAVKDAEQVARIVEKLSQACFGEPFLTEAATFKAMAKFGIALHPDDGADAESLFRNAEAALKKAKAGGERYLFYSPVMTERVVERLTLENKLRRALDANEFVLHYQPRVDLETRRITGVEALIRWSDPATGPVSPTQFIPLMEETGLILEIGAWALGRAVRDHGRWLALGLTAPRIAVNVSAIQLRQGNFVEMVREGISAGPSPSAIDIEITESLVMEDIENNIGKLRMIRAMGMNIAIDDFGTGYSSLAYLARLPVQTLKIDRSFIITMLRDPGNMTLVSTIVSLGHSLGLKVVAEGVDREEQAKILRLLLCDEMQGYLFSKPLSPEEMPDWIRDQERLSTM